MDVCGQRHVPVAIIWGISQYIMYRQLGGSQGRYGQVRKISLPQGFDPQTVQTVAIRCTDWAMPVTDLSRVELKIRNATTWCVQAVFIRWYGVSDVQCMYRWGDRQDNRHWRRRQQFSPKRRCIIFSRLHGVKKKVMVNKRLVMHLRISHISKVRCFNQGMG
jgi:hypothetical protein